MNRNDERVKELQSEYEKIEVPDNLQLVVQNAINQAKGEGERKKTMKSKTIIIRSLQTVAAAAIALTVGVNVSPSFANAMENVPVLGAFTSVVTFRDYKEATETTELSVKVPVVENVETENEDAEKLEESIEVVNKSIEEYTDELKAIYDADIDKMIEEGSLVNESINSDYVVITDTDKLFSLRIDTTVAKGGAVNLSRFYHIDKTTNEVITLKNLFTEGSDYITVISDDIKRQMRAEMAANENIIYLLDSDDGFDEFDFSEIKADNNFYINENGELVIVFDEYEVAPGYMGIVEIKVASEAIKDIVNDGFLK